MVIGRTWGRREGCIRRLHMLADLKSRHDLTACLVRETSNQKAHYWWRFYYKQDCGDVFLAPK